MTPETFDQIFWHQHRQALEADFDIAAKKAEDPATDMEQRAIMLGIAVQIDSLINHIDALHAN